jgi:hypothetical protein
MFCASVGIYTPVEVSVAVTVISLLEIVILANLKVMKQIIQFHESEFLEE